MKTKLKIQPVVKPAVRVQEIEIVSWLRTAMPGQRFLRIERYGKISTWEVVSPISDDGGSPRRCRNLHTGTSEVMRPEYGGVFFASIDGRIEVGSEIDWPADPLWLSPMDCLPGTLNPGEVADKQHVAFRVSRLIDAWGKPHHQQMGEVWWPIGRRLCNVSVGCLGDRMIAHINHPDSQVPHDMRRFRIRWNCTRWSRDRRRIEWSADANVDRAVDRIFANVRRVGRSS